MGRVFRYEQLTDGAAPDAETFSAAADAFVELSQKEISVGTLYGAFIFGSVAINRTNPRSDFDALIATYDTSPETYSKILELVNGVREASDNKIPMGIITYQKECLEEGRHEMDRYFGHHLSSKDRVIVGYDPSDYIRYPDTSSRDVVGRYIFSKRRVLSNAYTALTPHEAVDDGGLQRMLELPNAIGRKVVHAISESEDTEGLTDACSGSDKLAVEIVTREVMDDHDLDTGFNRLLTVNSSYSDLVEATILGEIEADEYDREIAAIHAELPHAISWLDQLGKILLPKLDVGAMEHN